MENLKDISNQIKVSYVNNNEEASVYTRMMFHIPALEDAFIDRFEIYFSPKFNYFREEVIIRHVINHVMSDPVTDKIVAHHLGSPLQYQFSDPVQATHIILDFPNTKISTDQLLDSFTFEVPFDESEEQTDDVLQEDFESISYLKKVYAPNAINDAQLITNGSLQSICYCETYPCLIDIDLESVYDITEIQLFLLEEGYHLFKIYGSIDGQNYNFITEKTTEVPEGVEGWKENIKTKARWIRVSVEYYSASPKVGLRQIRVLGEKTNQTNIPTDINKRLDIVEPVIDEVMPEDIISEVKGIVKRRLGTKYVNWFTFEVDETHRGDDYFQLTFDEEKIKVTGNTGVNLAMGINHYLKYFCHVNLTQEGMGDQAVMPAHPPVIFEPIYRKTAYKLRYAYNYTTHSYTMPFWGEEEWRKELDWLALNGVNLILDITGQEAVWLNFLQKLGYTKKEAKDFIAGPTYSAWFSMQNMYGFGGPLHEEWFTQRTQLARKNQMVMKRLGMTPVLQGYSGMVPVDYSEQNKEAKTIEQGLWCAFRRPAVLRTDSAMFEQCAKLFYESQQEIYGKVTHYYAVDPFHEGGNRGDLSPVYISQKVLSTMIDYDPEAVWVIQSWQENPTPALLKGLGEYRENHALILDLYAERTPNWIKTEKFGGSEFSQTPWLFCMLNNFGGRMGLTGHIDTLLGNLLKAMSEAKQLKGIGITPEASQTNPLLFDLFFELIWQDNDMIDFDLQEWLKHYAERRYGAKSVHAEKAVSLLVSTVYLAENNQLGQGAPESIINARPSIDVMTASTWGNAIISYDTKDLVEVAVLLLNDYDKLSSSDGYRYDLISVLGQVLSNAAQKVYKNIVHAITNKNIAAFHKQKETFHDILTLVDQNASFIPVYRLDEWINLATKAAEGMDDFTRDLFQRNAKALVTTWGSLRQANTGGLSDYSNRQWAGLTESLYKKRWGVWFADQEKLLKDEKIPNRDTAFWFDMEWKWVLYHNETKIKEEIDLRMLSTQVVNIAQSLERTESDG